MCVQALHNAWLVRAHTAPHAGRQPCRCYTHGARTQRASVHNVRGRSTLRAKRPHAADAHMCAHAHAPREAGEHAVHVAAAPAPDVVQAHAAERLAVGWWWWSRVVEVAAAAAVHVRRGRWPVPSAHHPCPHPTPPPATHTPHTNTHHTPHNPPPPLLLNTTRPCPPPRVASAPPPPPTHTPHLYSYRACPVLRSTTDRLLVLRCSASTAAPSGRWRLRCSSTARCTAKGSGYTTAVPRSKICVRARVRAQWLCVCVCVCVRVRCGLWVWMRPRHNAHLPPLRPATRPQAVPHSCACTARVTPPPPPTDTAPIRAAHMCTAHTTCPPAHLELRDRVHELPLLAGRRLRPVLHHVV
jgi:hypothetical protein